MEQIAMLNGLGRATQQKRNTSGQRRLAKKQGDVLDTSNTLQVDRAAVEEEISFIEKIMTFLGENKIIVAAVAGVFVIGTGVLIYRRRKNRR